MRRNRFLVSMVTIGVVVGWVMGYYAGVTWWSVLVLFCVVFASAFTLKLVEVRKTRTTNPKKKKAG